MNEWILIVYLMTPSARVLEHEDVSIRYVESFDNHERCQDEGQRLMFEQSKHHVGSGVYALCRQKSELSVPSPTIAACQAR